MILIRKKPYGTILEEGKAYFVELEETDEGWGPELHCHISLFDDEGHRYRYESLLYSSYKELKRFWYGI